MRFLRVSLLVCSLVQLMSSTDTSGRNAGLQQVQINSRWGGLGRPASSQIAIVREGSKFRAGRGNVNPELVSNLVTAIREPAIADISLANLGITPEWLITNHEGPTLYYQGGPNTGAQN
jgi:hypothetical protein